MSIKAGLPAEASKGENSLFEDEVAKVSLRLWVILMYIDYLCEDSANEECRKQNYLKPSVPNNSTKLKQASSQESEPMKSLLEAPPHHHPTITSSQESW